MFQIEEGRCGCPFKFVTREEIYARRFEKLYINKELKKQDKYGALKYV